jgi:hypothetical protein
MFNATEELMLVSDSLTLTRRYVLMVTPLSLCMPMMICLLTVQFLLLAFRLIVKFLMMVNSQRKSMYTCYLASLLTIHDALTSQKRCVLIMVKIMSLSLRHSNHRKKQHLGTMVNKARTRLCLLFHLLILKSLI